MPSDRSGRTASPASRSPPKTESSAALPVPDRPQAAPRSLKPPAQQAAKSDMAEPPPTPRPVERPVVGQPSLPPAAASPPQLVTKTTESPPAVAPAPKEVIAQPPLPSTEPTSAEPSSSKLAAAAPAASSAENSALMPASPERVAGPQLGNFRAVPHQREQRSAIASSPPVSSQLPASPQLESPAPIAPNPPPANTLALAPPVEKAEPSPPGLPVPSKTIDRSIKTSPRAPASPAATAGGPPDNHDYSRQPAISEPSALFEAARARAAKAEGRRATFGVCCGPNRDRRAVHSCSARDADNSLRARSHHSGSNAAAAHCDSRGSAASDPPSALRAAERVDPAHPSLTLDGSRARVRRAAKPPICG